MEYLKDARADGGADAISAVRKPQGSLLACTLSPHDRVPLHMHKLHACGVRYLHGVTPHAHGHVRGILLVKGTGKSNLDIL